jgi:hypothetical protein
MQIDIKGLEELGDDEITRLQAQRLAAYSDYKAQLSKESGVQRCDGATSMWWGAVLRDVL